MLKLELRSGRRLFAPAPAALLVGLLAGASAALATPWSNISSPSKGLTEVIGGPANGCIGGAETLSKTGPGYVSVRRYRNRYYGHPDLLSFIQDLGWAQQRSSGGLVMIGDLSQPRGGRMSSSHRSHQNGLDVDIWMTLVSSPAEASRLMDHRSDPQTMVAPGGRSVSGHWGTAQRTLIETAARHPRVDRIFVNPAIKRDLCQTAQGDRLWLRKIRPWQGHAAHFHVRLTCPPDSPQCSPQSPVPAGDGCGSELAWWFSDEARSPKKGSSKPTHASRPATPAACSAVLQAQARKPSSYAGDLLNHADGLLSGASGFIRRFPGNLIPDGFASRFDF
ncbi:penicillin-insensitive murein endopeptidase [Thiorhodococcus mannitoliphagus]|uniref:Penicillin-insensitive murein endopeptidase n=1 Tax=Thiorhodococcus mannitoliphagus TaxID=329406 RepID=A0A6P1DWV6_9GAMM|nr:penicillin-insensitive murein endopeptidase [Thiorhodococcus mannitoliphagus]NEX22668.1 penicillin-insensitive murein endopeptidase [Thiorhodococcus mannitoliphagus]